MSFNELCRRVGFWFQRDKITRELEEEMRIHVAMRAESLGRSRDDQETLSEASAHDLSSASDPAYHAARRRFGNTTSIQQRGQEMWGFGRFEDLTNDVRFAFRRLAQRPAFAASVVGVMAIGIGATTAMFSAVDAALLRPLPFNQPDRLVTLPVVNIPSRDPLNSGISRGRGYEIGDAVEMKSTFSEVGAYGAGALDLNDRENPVHVNVGVVSANFFQLLGAQPLKGRAFVDDESTPPAPRVVVLSYGLWQRAFGGRDIAGLKISLADNLYEVIGVMPAGFGFPKLSDLWIPMSVPYVAETTFPFSDGFDITVVARLANGVSVSQASSRLRNRWQQLRRSRLVDTTNKNDYITRQMTEEGAAIVLQDRLVGDRKTPLLVLLGATGLLLLVACVNVTNLLLANSAARAREIAVRQVLGATRLRIIRQLLTESIVLSFGGALLSVMFAPFAFGVLTMLLPKAMIGLAPAQIDVRILAFAATLAMVTGVTFGMWPAVGSARKDSSDIIKSGGGHGSTHLRGGRVRRLLVGAELALTTALLIGAALMLQSFRQLMGKETGMQTAHVASLQFSFPRRSDGADVIREERLEQILQKFSAMPDIVSAGFVSDLPLGASLITVFRMRVPGAASIKSDDPDATMTREIQVTSGYFAAMGIKLLRGRLFSTTDVATRANVAIIGERMAKTYWPDREAVGSVFYGSRDSVPITVVGVVADVREMRLEYDPMMQAYQPMNHSIPTTVALVVRSALPDAALLARMTAVVRLVDNTQAVFDARMMDDVVDRSVAPRRTNMLLINTFALLALVLASVGIYAVVSYGVSHRSRELGIRSALGATGSHLMRLISREMVWVVSVGVASGVAGAWALAKALESLVYGVSVHDPVTFVVVPLVLIIPVVIATIVPARRVLRIDPAQVMRAD